MHFDTISSEFMVRKKDNISSKIKIDIHSNMGKLILSNDTLKRREDGKNVIVAIFKSEDERVRGLSEYFGINLTESERTAIFGRKTCLKTQE